MSYNYQDAKMESQQEYLGTAHTENKCETLEIDNPCYHCYTGAIGECYGVGCKYAGHLWSGDLWEDYKVEIEKEEADK